MSDTNTRISHYPKRQFMMWALGVIYLIFATTDIILLFLTRSLDPSAGWGFRGFQLAISAPFVIIGILMLRNQPKNLLGWLMLIGGPTSLISEIGLNYWLYSTNFNPGMPFIDVAIWVNNWAWMFATIIFLTYLPLLFPTGKPVSPRWHYVGWLAVGMGIIIIPIMMFYPVMINFEEVVNPFGLNALAKYELNQLFVLSSSTVFPGALATISLVIRFKRSKDTERQQMKWGMLAMVMAVPLPLVGALDHPLVNVSLVLLVFASAGGLAFSILRYRLWDIDIILNRSMVYGAMTLILVALFGISFGLLRLMVQHMGQEHGLYALLIAAVVFGAVFQPARYRLQKWVDQHLYNIQIDWQKKDKVEEDTNPQILAEAGVGDFHDLELIGEGGMAKVFKATHPETKQPVALKVLPARLAEDEQFTTRFEREAQTIQRLDHPNIVKLYGYGKEEGRHFMVMEYLNGADLSAHLKDVGAVLYHEALPLAEQIASALDYAHGQGLVHRDIKPSNVMLDKNNGSTRAVLMDFGIAKILDKTAMTNTGSMLGTFDYVSPEQIQGSADVDQRADVYSFGVMVYQMLTGRLPFETNNPAAMLMAHLNQPAPDPRQYNRAIPEQTAKALLRAMAKKPEERFASAGELVGRFK